MHFRPIIAVLLLACGAPCVAYAQSSRDTVAETLPRMVKIFGAGGRQSLHSYSSGFLISAEGHVVTVWSHVLFTDQITAVLNDGRRFTAKLVGQEPKLDLAVLKLDEEGLDLPYFDLANAESAGPGTRILAFSNMFKVATGDEPVSVTHGVVSSLTTLEARRGTFESTFEGPVYIVDAITNNSGAAGGVITTRDGKLIAMIGKELRNSASNTWVNYGVPITDLRDTIDEIISGKFSPTPEETIPEANPRRYAPLDFGIVLLPDVLYRTPAYIDTILPDSAAADAELQRDDLILFVNDKLVHSARMLKEELGRLEAGDDLRLTVRRQGQLVSVTMPVNAKDAE